MPILENVSPKKTWNNLANHRVLHLGHRFFWQSVTLLLDIFESVPLLHTVNLHGPIRGPSEMPERIVPLHHLKALYFLGKDPHLTLLRHLHIPVGALLVSGFTFRGGEFPLLNYLPERSPNFNNLSHVTSVNLLLDCVQKNVRLSRPSESLRMQALMEDKNPPFSYTANCQILHSLRNQMSSVGRVTITEYRDSMSPKVEECPIFQTLLSPKHIRTLILIDCDNRPFARALDPEGNPSNVVLCNKMEELVLYVRRWSLFDAGQLDRTVKNRASRGAKLSITLFEMDGTGSRQESKPEEHAILSVSYRLRRARAPGWDVD
jgi:hypothetical protein